MAQTAEAQLKTFLAKFDPAVAKLIGACRKRVRALLPTAVELVYDNYNFFVIGYCATPRASDCVVSIAAASNGVGLSFYYGARVPDPDGLLLGSGKQNRFVRLPEPEVLDDPRVIALIRAATLLTPTPMPKTGKGGLVIQSISKKQRPRSRPAKPKKANRTGH